MKLMNVRMSNFHYCDIFILISSSKITKTQWDILKNWHDHCKSGAFDKNKDPSKDYIDASKIE